MLLLLLHELASCFGGNVGNVPKCRWNSSIILLLHWRLFKETQCLFYFTLPCLTETEDLGSVDLPDLASARDEALRFAQTFATAVTDADFDPGICVVEVTDESHLLVQVIH